MPFILYADQLAQPAALFVAQQPFYINNSRCGECLSNLSAKIILFFFCLLLHRIYTHIRPCCLCKFNDLTFNSMQRILLQP